MSTRIQRWGNSLAVRIPKPVASELGLEEGSEVGLEVREGVLAVRPLERRYSLGELVSEIRESNRHEEQDWGPPKGREAW
jgi:antitoxin MazE